MKIIKYLLILCIFFNVMLVFSNIFNTAWTIEQIDLWLGSPNSSERLIPEEGQKNVPPIVINGEVSANIERENINKN